MISASRAALPPTNVYWSKTPICMPSNEGRVEICGRVGVTRTVCSQAPFWTPARGKFTDEMWHRPMECNFKLPHLQERWNQVPNFTMMMSVRIHDRTRLGCQVPFHMFPPLLFLFFPSLFIYTKNWFLGRYFKFQCFFYFEGGRGVVGCLLFRTSMVRSPVPPVCMCKCPWAWNSIPNCSQWGPTPWWVGWHYVESHLPSVGEYVCECVCKWVNANLF